MRLHLIQGLILMGMALASFSSESFKDYQATKATRVSCTDSKPHKDGDPIILARNFAWSILNPKDSSEEILETIDGARFIEDKNKSSNGNHMMIAKDGSGLIYFDYKLSLDNDNNFNFLFHGKITDSGFEMIYSKEPFQSPMNDVYLLNVPIDKFSSGTRSTAISGGDQDKDKGNTDQDKGKGNTDGDGKKKDDSGYGATIGIVLGALGGALLLAGGGYWYWKKQKNAQGYQAIPSN
jgi:LPXTG-motif cell wall-anchored protein